MAEIKPTVKIVYKDTDVSRSFAPYLLSVEYADSIDGKSPDIDINLRNDHEKFISDWFPSIDDNINIQFGYENGGMLDAGNFWVDEVSFNRSSAGSTCNIRAISIKGSDINSSQKVKPCSKNSKIADIVNEIADIYGCTVEGDLSGDYSGTQENETDIAFVSRIASETGRIFKQENGKFIFYKIGDIATGNALKIDVRNVVSYRISDKAEGRIKECICKWWDEESKKEISGKYRTNEKTGSSVVIREEVKDSADAQEKAKNYVENRIKKGVDIDLSMVGDVRLRSGVKVLLSGLGKYSRDYYISEAKHSFGEGYTTQIKLKEWSKQE